MNDVAIRVGNLGKLYRIGALQNRNDTLRDTLTDAFTSPFRRLWGNPKSEIRNPKLEAIPFRRLRENSQFAIRNSKSEHIWALKDVSFEVKHGEVVGIIGRNGAGKTTLLKILSRITKPTEGRAEIHGRIGSLLEVGTGFHPELTGRENIYLNGAILGMKRAEIQRKFDEIVSFAEIEKFIDMTVKHYSSGMYVRLAFAVAAHLEPDILLVDEVLAVGDAAFQKKCLGKMGDVAKEGRTVLFVSHNMAAINALAARCLVLKDGRLEMSGVPATVTTRYLSDSLPGDRGGVVDLNERIRLRSSKALNASPGFIKLTKLEMTDSQGIPSNQFCAGDPITISVSFDVKRRIEQFEIGLAVSAMGVRVFIVKTGKRAWRAAPSSYTISTVLDPNYLTEGIYSISIGIHSSSWQDGANDLASFEIIPNPGRPVLHPMFSGGPGLVDIGYSWGDPVRDAL